MFGMFDDIVYPDGSIASMIAVSSLGYRSVPLRGPYVITIHGMLDLMGVKEIVV